MLYKHLVNVITAIRTEAETRGLKDHLKFLDVFSVDEEEGEGDLPVPEPQGHVRVPILLPEQDAGGHGLRRIVEPLLLHYAGNGM